MTALDLALKGALLGLSSAAAPGPYQAIVIARALRAGPARALPLALVPVTSDPVVIAVVVGVLSQVPRGLLAALGVVGGAVVLWLGAATVRAAVRAPGDAPEVAAAPARGFWSTVAVNVTNPNAWLFWSAVGGPLLATAWRAAPAQALAFLLAFYACITGGNAAVVLLAGGLARAGPRAARALGLCSGLALLVFGVWQLWSVLA